MPMKNGTQYKNNLDSLRPNIWVRGMPLDGSISDHPAFRGLIASQASLYDMQWDTSLQDMMSYESPTTGSRVGLSFLRPTSIEELMQRRIMMTLWAEQHHGFLGRSPDYMNTALMAFYAASGILTEQPQHQENLQHYYEYCRENDITLSHAFIQPQACRFSAFLEDLEEEPLSAKVIESNKDGIIVNGAFLMATQGATAEEILVFPTPFPTLTDGDNPYTFAFAVPNNLPGMKLICRESFVTGDSAFDYPLSSRFEEMDTLVIFDHTLVPHNRVFLYGDEGLAYQFVEASRFHTHVTHQVLCRNIAKTEFMLGTIEHMVQSLGTGTYSHVIDMVTEIIVALETLKCLLISSEVHAKPDKWGTMVPDSNPLLAANVLYPKIFPRIVEIFQLIGGSGIIMIPSEKDFTSENAAYLNKYLKGVGLDSRQKIALFRLAWEISSSSFGGRQTMYERFFFGDSSKLANRLYHGYQGKEKWTETVKRFLE